MPLTVESGGRAAIHDLRTAISLLADDTDLTELLERVEDGQIVPVTLRKGGSGSVYLPGQLAPWQPQSQLALPNPKPVGHVGRYEIDVRMLFPIRATVQLDAPNRAEAVKTVEAVFAGEASMTETGFDLTFDINEVQDTIEHITAGLQYGAPENLGVETVLIDKIHEIELIEG